MRDDSRKKVLGERKRERVAEEFGQGSTRIRDFAIVFDRGIPGRIRDKSIVGVGK